ncbi:MAG: hypothetical protein AAFU61_11910 [Pseudomonadota bacterium]
MKQIFAVAALLFAGPALADPNWTPPPAKDGFSYPPCYCRNHEEKVGIGELGCLRIGSREVLARCRMSLNNPAWETLGEGCEGLLTPGASLELPQSRKLDAVQPG